MLSWWLNSLEDGNGFIDTILQLQVVDEDHLVRRTHFFVDYLFLDECV
jgi:hypothetical protein